MPSPRCSRCWRGYISYDGAGCLPVVDASDRGKGKPLGDTLDVHVKAYQGNLYDFDNFIQLKWYPKRVMQLANCNGSLLELGLGHGITTSMFERHFKRHTVLDASGAVIENFRKNYPDSKAKVIKTYFEDFESDETYEVIVLGYILEHVEHPGVILKHFRKFLAPEGVMFVTVPNAEVLNRRLGHIAGMLPDILTLSDHDRLLGHRRYYTVATLRQEIASAGYAVETMEGIYLKPFTTAQMISMNFSDAVIDALCEVGIAYPELSCGILAKIRPSL